MVLKAALYQKPILIQYSTPIFISIAEAYIITTLLCTTAAYPTFYHIAFGYF